MQRQPGISKDVGFNKGAHLSDQTRSPFAAAGITGCPALQPLISLGSQRLGQKGLFPARNEMGPGEGRPVSSAAPGTATTYHPDLWAGPHHRVNGHPFSGFGNLTSGRHPRLFVEAARKSDLQEHSLDIARLYF